MLLWGLSSEEGFSSFVFLSLEAVLSFRFRCVSSSLAACILRCYSLLSAREWFRCHMTIQSQRRGTRRTQSIKRVQQADPSTGRARAAPKSVFSFALCDSFESQLGRRALARVDAPQIDRQAPPHRHDRFLFRGAGGFGIDQHRLPFFQRWILGLKADTTPGQFDQGSANALVAVLGDGAAAGFGSTGAHPRTHAGKAGHLPAVFKSVPIQYLPLQYLAGQGSDATRLTDGSLFQALSGCLQLSLHRFQKVVKDREQVPQRCRHLCLHLAPLCLLPPTTLDPDSIKEQEASPLGFKTQPVRQQLLALTALAAGHFLFRRGHTNNGQFLFVAVDVATEPLDHGQRVRLVRLDSFVMFIPVLRSNDEVVNAHRFQLAMQ